VSGAFQRGIDAYAAGQHYEAHEFWEELWHEETDDARSRFLQALIQVASAVHKIRNDVAPRGSLNLLGRATGRLAGLPATFMSVDVAHLQRDIEVARERLDCVLAGHGTLADVPVPSIVQREELPMWPTPDQAEPLVPHGARRAWFDRGLACYHAGEFFEAHEMWEEIWRDERDGQMRQGLQGLIQVAASMYKICEQKKPAPAARLLERALMRLRTCPSSFAGLRMDVLVRSAELAHARLLQLAQQHAVEFDRDLVPEMQPLLHRLPASDEPGGEEPNI